MSLICFFQDKVEGLSFFFAASLDCFFISLFSPSLSTPTHLRVLTPSCASSLAAAAASPRPSARASLARSAEA